jgi:hypothetical protein
MGLETAMRGGRKHVFIGWSSIFNHGRSPSVDEYLLLNYSRGATCRSRTFLDGALAYLRLLLQVVRLQ